MSWELKSRPERQRYRLVKRPDHPIAPPCGVVGFHRIVLYDSIGPGSHPCHCCGKTVTWEDGTLLADHVDSNTLNNDAANLAPACFGCNLRRPYLIRPDEAFRVAADGTRTRGDRRACARCGKDFVTWEPSTRHCSRSCAVRAQLAKYGHPSTIPPGEPVKVETDGHRRRLEEKVCPQCGQPFMAAKGRPRTYCSPGCGARARCGHPAAS